MAAINDRFWHTSDDLADAATSGRNWGRFGKQDFVYLAEENAYRCPAGEKHIYRYTNEENGQRLHRYWTNACRTCAPKLLARNMCEY